MSKILFKLPKRFDFKFKEYKRQFILVFVGIILSAIGTAGAAYLVKPALNQIFIQKDKNLLLIIPFAVIFLYTIKSVGSYLQSVYTAYIGQDLTKRFRDKIVSHILNQDMEFFKKHQVGELISRTINDIERIRVAVSNLIPDFVSQIFTSLALVFVVIYQSPKLSFFSLIIIPVAIYPLSRLSKKMKKASKESQERISIISSNLSEIFTNIEIIKVDNAEKKEIDEFRAHNEKYFKILMKSVRISNLTSPIMEVLGSIGIAVVIIIGGINVIENKIDPGSFFSFLTALFMLYTPIKKISNSYNRMQDAIAATERTFEILDENSKIISGDKKFIKDVKNIKYKDVSFYIDEKKILSGINLDIKKGEILALVGSSGGGKSSIVNLLMRLYDFKKGSILINGIDIKEFDIKDLRDHIAFVSQRIYIFADTIAKNVAYAKEFDEEKVIKCLKMANAYEFVKKMEFGIHSKLNEFGLNLSGGERQRIAIARALYKDPSIIIFDEATSALDNESEKEIISILNMIKKDKIIITIAHRLSSIKNASNLAVVQNGEIVGFGDDKTLSKECEIYRNLKALI